MLNESNFLRFPALNVTQTHRLLTGVSALSINTGAARRIRATVLQQAAPKSLKRNRIRKVLVPIAACLLAVVVFFTAFPKAALAVSEFFGRVFTPSRYMNEDPSARTPVPSIDEAIAAAAPADGSYTVTLMPDLPNAQEFIDYRAQNGYDAFSEENWGWLKDVRPEIAEVLYDGNQLIWNTNLYTTNEHVREFMEGFGVKSDSKLSVDALMGDVTYTVAGDPTVYELQVSGHGITPIFEEADLAKADHVVLYSDFYIDSEQPLPDGVITITQNIRVCENDAMDVGATVAIITHTFTFDTTKGNTKSAEEAEELMLLLPIGGLFAAFSKTLAGKIAGYCLLSLAFIVPAVLRFRQWVEAKRVRTASEEENFRVYSERMCREDAQRTSRQTKLIYLRPEYAEVGISPAEIARQASVEEGTAALIMRLIGEVRLKKRF